MDAGLGNRDWVRNMLPTRQKNVVFLGETGMLYLKSCPGCAGDVNGDSDSHGLYLKCLQCGFNKDLSPEMAAKLLARTMVNTDVSYEDRQAA
jgi:hypothetical protein